MSESPPTGPAATSPGNPPPVSSTGPGGALPHAAGPLSSEPHLLKDARAVKRRLTDEATAVVSMLETALAALWELDTQRAEQILTTDDRIDREEVAIEEGCFRVMTLQAPVARDFRLLTFILKVNADIERVADHACSIAKITYKLADNPPPSWPTALTELGQRVPMICHTLLRAMHDEDAAAAKDIVIGDKTIDRLNRRLFDEVIAMMDAGVAMGTSGGVSGVHATGLLLFRAGRELERIGDLMTNIAEDIVYLSTGEIIRHEKRRLRAERERAEHRPDRSPA